MQCPISIGTSGFSYPEWIEAGVYPEKTKSGHMLALYAEQFPIVELNYTWYQMVRKETVERMLDCVRPAFRFTAKLTRTMTHEISSEWKEQARLYRWGMKPLLETKKLVAILVQFPFSFIRSRANRYYLAKLFDELSPLPLAVEFRHHSWADEDVYSGLHDRRITLVTVDSPDLPQIFPCIDVVTNPRLFYLRLHGRNRSGWGAGILKNRFNYEYSEQELLILRDRVIEPMREECCSGVVLFNNYVAGQSVRNAQMLRRLFN